MRKIMVMNTKGGSGKTTLATNIASYYANRDFKVVLADLDPQRSSLEWLSLRSSAKPPIIGYDAIRRRGASRHNADIYVMDSPAALHGQALNNMVRRAETIVVPVLASPIDIRAVITFLRELKAAPAISGKRAKVAVVGNRVRLYTNIAWELEDFLISLRLSFPTLLRDSMNYVRAADKGLGIFDMSRYATAREREDWTPLLRWLGSKRSLPN